MKSAFKLFVAIFFILGVITVLQAQPYSVSGTVRYLDNNEIVTSGYVNLYDSQGILEATTSINMQGDYMLIADRILMNGDVIGIPDHDWEEDFIPTGYPDKIDPALFTHIDVTDNMTGIDLYVHRRVLPRFGTTTTISGTVLSDNIPIGDAIIYAMQGNDYVAFGITNAKGEYNINSIPVGDYILVAHKVGSKSDNKQVTITENGTNNFGFSLKRNSSNITNSTPYEFALVQNYPNPFNPSTVISYSISQQADVTLKVFNSIGQQVAELVNTTQSAGIYNINFNASSLSSGVYFYTLKANDFTATKKLMIVK